MTDKTFTTAFDSARHTTTLTLTKAESGNRLTGPDISVLAVAIRDGGQDEKNKLLVLRAEGNHFCLAAFPMPKAPRGRRRWRCAAASRTQSWHSTRPSGTPQSR